MIYPVQYDTYADGNIGGGGGGGTSWPSGRRAPTSGTDILGAILGGILGGGRRSGGGGGGSVIIGGGGNPNGNPDDYRRASAYLNDLAYKTGARLFRADNTRDLTQSFAFIAEELRRQYSIGYYPKTPAQAGTRRQLKVRVMRPDLVVRARDSYIAGASSGDTTAQGNSQRSKPVLRQSQLVGTK